MKNVKLETAVVTALESRGRAISRAEKSKDEVVNAMLKAGMKPADISKNVKEIKLLVANGMSKQGKYTAVELLKYEDKELKERIETMVTARAHTTDKAKKAKLDAQITELRAFKATRLKVDHKLSPEPAAYASALVTAYKKQLRQKLLTANKNVEGYTKADADMEADALGYEMKSECVGNFKIKMTDGEKRFDPNYVDPKNKDDNKSDSKDDNKSDSKDGNKSDSKAKGDSWMQQVTNALNALQATDNPPANVNKLVAELTKALEPNH